MALYSVPSKFYLDHANRCDLCYSNPLKVVKIGKLLTTLDLDPDMYQDLISDAEVYAELKGNEEYREMPDLINSAIKTLNRLKK
jgi:hypothetical protein